LPKGLFQIPRVLLMCPVLCWLLHVCVQHVCVLVGDTDGPCVASNGLSRTGTAWHALLLLLLHVVLLAVQV
jgi:hypothetical protein